jgi:hypothetical protein
MNEPYFIQKIPWSQIWPSIMEGFIFLSEQTALLVSTSILVPARQTPQYLRGYIQKFPELGDSEIHDSKQTRVKTAHAHPTTCNLAHWLTRHSHPTIYHCFALPQLLYIWRHQSRIFCIYSLISFFSRLECTSIWITLNFRLNNLEFTSFTNWSGRLIINIDWNSYIQVPANIPFYTPVLT